MTSNYVAISIVTALVTLLLIPITTEAQSTSARLKGTVWDPSDDPAPGVILTAVEENTGWQSEAVSDTDGHYIFLSLRPGLYTVTTKAKGFKETIRRHILLPAGGYVTESFTVDITVSDEEAVIEERVNADDSEISGNASRRDLDSLPLLSRNPLLLAPLQPGVQINGGNEGSSTVNGARKGMNTVSIDGLSAGDPVNPSLALSLVPMNPDSISELRVVSSGGKAEYGRSAGAQIGIVSRSGGRSWSGNLFDYLGHQEFNANDYFLNATGVSRPDFLQNTFGATLSGPIKEKRTFIFGNFQGIRTDTQIFRNRFVPTDAAKKGIFQWYTPGTDTTNAANLHTFDIVANDPRHLGIDPQIASILAKLPSSNNSLIGDGLNIAGFSFSSPMHQNAEQFSVRLDHSLNDHHRLFFRLNRNHTDATDVMDNADATFPNASEGTIQEHNWAFAAGSDFTLNPRMVNELRVGYIQPKTELLRPARSTQPMLLLSLYTNPLDPSFPSSHKSPIFEISDNLLHARDQHTFKYGFTFHRTNQESVDYSGAYPNITFGDSMGNTPSVGPSGNALISSTDRLIFENLYNDLLGRVESVSRTFYYDLTSPLPAGSARSRSFVSYDMAAFIQDDWRIRSNLTLNLGLRYEFNSVPKEQDGLQRVLSPASNINANANISNFKIVAGNGWRGRNVADFAPRAGFAWDISGTSKYVLRGAYGIYFDRLIGAITNLVDSNTYGFSQASSVYPNLSGTDIRLSNGIQLPAQPAVPNLILPLSRSASIAILDPKLRTPRIDQFSLTLERRFSNHTVFEVGYVGTRGRRLFENLDLNQTKTRGDFLSAFQQIQAYRDMGTPVPSSNTLIKLFGSPIAVLNALGGSNFTTGQVGVAANTLDIGNFSKYAAAGVSDFYLRNFPQFDRFIVGSDVGRSWFDSLQADLRTNAKSFRLRAHYSWGKSLDTISTDGAGFVSPSDSLNPQNDRAPSDFDRTHVVSASASYTFPMGRNRRFGANAPRFADWILGNWDMGGIFTWESGARFSVNSGLQTLFGGVTSLADYSGDRSIGDLHRTLGSLYWFSLDQLGLFTFPAAGEGGTSGRNSFRGPRYFNLDCSLFKEFPLRDRDKILIRIEAYNVLNKAHFGLPNSDLSSTDFGKFTSTVGTMRVIRVALRFEF